MVNIPSFFRIGPGAQPSPAEALEQKIRSRRAVVTVVGQGYVGYPLAQLAAQRGFRTIGFDVSSAALQRCTASNSSHNYSVTDSRDVFADSDVIIVAVPTPTVTRVDGTRAPDLGAVVAAVESIVPFLSEDAAPKLVVIESTYAPGTTRSLVAPILARTAVLGTDVFLGYSPERIDPGNASFDVGNTPKITSGLDEVSARLTHLLYERIVTTAISASSLEAAEATKIYENTFRLVNITFAQEFDEYCEAAGLDAREVTRLAATKPFGFMPFYAGAGIGGHCIAEDPYYLAEAIQNLGVDADILNAALRNHEARAGVIYRRICDRLNTDDLYDARILVLGVSYKPNIGDARQSPAAPIIELLEEAGAKVQYHDPFVPSFAGKESKAIEELSPDDFDLAVMITRHSSFDLNAMELDGWQVFDAARTPGAAAGAARRAANRPMLAIG